MGSEVSKEHFSNDDFVKFRKCLQQETDYLVHQIANGKFSNHSPVAGCEIEACFIDSAAQPAPVNQEFLQRFNHSMATPELAKFNMELNTEPRRLEKMALQQFDNDIHHLVNQANQTAADLEANILLTGILPTLNIGHFCLENMSDMKRYHALNELILQARGGQPLHLQIKGHDSLKLDHNSVMLESATTSLQLHLQAPIEQAHHYYNASILASGPMMAVTGNAPFLFGKQLWHETRIPMFEQSIHLGKTPQRVSFGTGYVNSMQDCFKENLEYYPVILPMLLDEPVEKFANLSLHNGVIWRWNRPLVGFDPDGTPHVRIEHRVMPSGPTIVDMIANAAFYYGLTQYFASYLQSHSNPVSFTEAKNNFYSAAQNGLETQFTWTNQRISAKNLIIKDLLPLARKGLEELQIDKDSADYYLNIIQARAESGQTGASWQIEHARRQSYNMKDLTLDYLRLQNEGKPVHTWSH